MFVIVNFKKNDTEAGFTAIFVNYTEFVGTFLIYLHTKFHISSSGFISYARFHAATVLFLHSTEKILE
jgi:hypothetical protein